MSATVEKVSIIISKGSLDGVYPGLIMANGARAEGIEANLFFTFFGLDAIHKARHEQIKLATVGNPGLHFATMLGGLPGVSSVMTHYMTQKMEKLDIPSIPEFIEMIADTGAGLYACKASADLFGLEKNDFIPQVADIITVGRVLREGRWRPHHLHLTHHCKEAHVRDTVEEFQVALVRHASAHGEVLPSALGLMDAECHPPGGCGRWPGWSWPTRSRCVTCRAATGLTK